MTTATQVADRIAYRVHDKDEAELSAADYLTFLNDAVEDLSAAAWVLPLTAELVAQVTGTYEYNVPATFAYAKEVRKESGAGTGVYNQPLAFWVWSLFLQAASTPRLRVDSRWETPVTGQNYLVLGQQRVAAYAGATTVEPGLIGFLRERGTAYAAGHLAGGGSEYAQLRRELAEIAFRNSEVMLQNMPEEFRVEPGARPVPSR